MKKLPSFIGEYKKSGLISVLLHLMALLGLLLGSYAITEKPKPIGSMIQATVIDPAIIQKQAQAIRQQRELAAQKEQERQDALREQTKKLAEDRQREEEKIRQLKIKQAQAIKAAQEAENAKLAQEKAQKIAKQKAEQEKAKADALARARQEKEAAEKKAKQERLKKQQAELAAQKAAEKAAAEKAAKVAAQEKQKKMQIAREKAQQAKLEQERQKAEQDSALASIFDGLQKESAQNQGAEQKFQQSEIARYSLIYRQLIQAKLLKDDYLIGKSCRLNISLVPTGVDAIVSSIKVLSGDAKLCQAAKSAIHQVSTFPIPKDKDIVNKLRNINLTVDYKN